MKKYVAGLMFSKDSSQIALVVKNKPDWQKGLLNGIGGKIEDSDTNSLCAMMREFKEETGVIHEGWELFLTMGSGTGNSEDGDRTQQYSEGWSVDFYRAFTDKVFDCTTKEAEEIKILEVNNALCSMTIDNLKWIIHLALDKNPKITHATY